MESKTVFAPWERSNIPQDKNVLMLPRVVLREFPGSLLVFDASLSLVAAHPEDGALVRLYRSDSAGILTLAEQAARSKAVRTETLQVASPNGLRIFDLTLLPVEDGGVAILARETPLSHNLQSGLGESRQRYKDLVEMSSDFAWEVDAAGRFVFVSPRGALGYAAADLIGGGHACLLQEPAEADDNPFMTRRRIEEREVWLRRRNGKPACVRLSAKPLFDNDATWIGSRGVCRDVTQEHERNAAFLRVRNRERIVNHIVRTFHDEVDPENMLHVAAETVAHGMEAVACQIFRRPVAEDPAEAKPSDAPPPSRWTRARLIPGARYGARNYADALPAVDALVKGTSMVDMIVDGHSVLAAPLHYRDRLNGAIVVWRTEEHGDWTDDDRLLLIDVADQIGIANEQIVTHENILKLSRTDALTGLFNRRAFFEELSRRFKRSQHGRQSAALIYLDVDNFKSVNDQRGHAEGDAVLCLVRDMLTQSTRPTDLIARLGGDEFAVWIEKGVKDVACKKAQKLLDLAESKLRPHSGSTETPLGFSIGVAVYDPLSSETLQDLMSRADQAMYTVKREGKQGMAVAPDAADVLQRPRQDA